jgi:hypothetical protein
MILLLLQGGRTGQGQVVVATFRLYLENIGGYILLLVVSRELGSWSFPQVVARETRGLEPPSSCSWKTKEVGASNECNSSRHIRKSIP